MKKKIKEKVQIFFLRLFSKKSCSSKMCFLKGEGFSSKGVFPQGDFLAIFLFVCRTL